MKSPQGVVWLASSDAEISRARDLLRALTTPGVLDELGFLVLLGALSDRLYPALNTIMTRSRYLIFVPAIYRHIEQQELAKNRSAASVARELQYRLRSALYETSPNERGIIGRDAGRDVARPPSNVYWNALGDLGIAIRRVSEHSYLEGLNHPARVTGRLKDDDGVTHSLDDTALWDPSYSTDGILTRKGAFAKGTSFTLSRLEARQLRDRYDSLRPDGELSLLSHLLTLPPVDDSAQVVFTHPWALPSLPTALERTTDHARCLSLFARGTLLHYHALLFEKRHTSDPGTEPAFTAWWKHAKSPLATWDLTNFASIPCIARSIRHDDLAFIEDWRNIIASSRSAASAYRSIDGRERVRKRELGTRGQKARLASPFHLRQWLPLEQYRPDDYYALTYRHRIGTQFAFEIATGLGAKAR